MVSLNTTFHTPYSNESFLIVIKPKAKLGVHAAAILLFYILQTNYVKKSYVFS